MSDTQTGASDRRRFIEEHYAIAAEDYDAPRLVSARGRALSEHDVALFSELLVEAGASEDDYALEVAAGTGRFTNLALAHVGRILVTDINSSLLTGLSSRIAPADADRVVARIEDAFDLSFGDAAFDLVYAIHFIPRLLSAADQTAAISEMSRVLRPGGRLIVNFRNRRSLVYGRAYGDHAISLNEFALMVRKAGLRPLQYRAKHLLARRLLDLMPMFLVPGFRKLDWILRKRRPDRAWDVFVLAEKPEQE